MGGIDFACKVVVAMVARGSTAEAGQICRYAVERGALDVVTRVGLEMLVQRYTREAAAVAAAFFAAARSQWKTTKPVFDVLSDVIADAVRRGHAEQVAEVTDTLVAEGHAEFVTSIMQRMIDRGKRAHCIVKMIATFVYGGLVA